MYYKLMMREGELPTPVPCTADEACFGNGNRVAKTVLPQHVVSTVFLVTDHRFDGEGPPVLFETMVFDSTGAEADIDRYATWAEALDGHARMVQAWSAR
jgi:hypothetical protein